MNIGDIVQVEMPYMGNGGYKHGRIAKIGRSFGGDVTYEIHGYRNANKKDDCFITTVSDRMIKQKEVDLFERLV